MLKKARNLFIFAVVAFFPVKATTYGWLFFSRQLPADYLPATSENELRKHVDFLAEKVGSRDPYLKPESLQKAQDYIAARFRSLGYEVTYQEYQISLCKVRNIIAEKRGMTAPGEIVVVGAHYDTYRNPGADDNASGVASLIEIAAHAVKGKYARTLRFVAFANEEPPFFQEEEMGSRVYAKAAAAAKDDIKAAIILEMTGYYAENNFSQKYPPLLGPFFPSKGGFIAQVSNFNSSELVGRLSTAFSSGTQLPLRTVVLPTFIPGIDYSDHSSFWEYGYKAVMFTDTSFYRNVNYHKATDVPGTLDYRYMAAFVDGAAQALDSEAKKI